MPSVPPPSPPSTRGGETKYIRAGSLHGAHLYPDGCRRVAARRRAEEDIGERGTPSPFPSASKSLYQPGNYTSFRAISSTLVEGIGRGGGGGGGLLLVSRWRAHHHLALVSFHCDSPSPAPLSPGRY